MGAIRQEKRPLAGALPYYLAGTIANRYKVLFLFLGEQSRLGYEAYSEWYFEREARAATGRNVDRQVRVLPMLELAPRYIEATTMDFSNLNVAGADPEFAVLETHG